MNESKPAYIYALEDPRDGQIRYVGRTISPQWRFRQHIHERTNGRRIAWNEDMKDAGVRPRVIVLEICDQGVMKEREVFWMFHYFAHGSDLLNAIYPGYPRQVMLANSKLS